MKKLITTVAITALSLGALSACGSDDDNDVPGVTNPIDDTTLDTIDSSMTSTLDTTMTSDDPTDDSSTPGGDVGTGGDSPSTTAMGGGSGSGSGTTMP